MEHTRSYGDIAFEFNILTNDSFRVKCELVASEKKINKLFDQDSTQGILNTLVASSHKILFVLDWRGAELNADGKVAMDCRIRNNYNMQVRLHFFPSKRNSNASNQLPQVLLSLASTEPFVIPLAWGF